MKRIVLFLVVLLIFGYFAWPAFSMYQIYDGLKREDKPVLEQKVNWPSLRASFKEAIRPIVEKEMERRSSAISGGASGALAKELGAPTAKIVDLIVEAYMTPEGLIRLAAAGGKIDLDAFGLNDMLTQLGVGGGGDNSQSSNVFGQLLQGVEKTAKGIPGLSDQLKDLTGDKQSQTDQEKRSVKSKKADQSEYSLDNIKSLGFNSLTEFEVAVAKVASASKPDVTAVMEFQEFDWKLTKLIPHEK